MSKRLPLEVAMEMFEIGVEMREQRFRRDNPHAAEADIKAMMIEWMRWRPGAAHGDAHGRPVELPRQA